MNELLVFNHEEFGAVCTTTIKNYGWSVTRLNQYLSGKELEGCYEYGIYSHTYL